MKKLIINTIFAVAALAPLHAKIYSFADFSADFKKQPVVTQEQTVDGIQFTQYQMDFSDAYFFVGVYKAVFPQGIAANKDFLYGRAAGNANGIVERYDDTIAGYPAVGFRYSSNVGSVTDVYVYAFERVIRVYVIAKPEKLAEADRFVMQFMQSMKIKAAPPSETEQPIRRAEPVRNGDSIGDI